MTDAVGHIIGRQFGGFAEYNSMNIIPQNAVLNNGPGGMWKQFEMQVSNRAMMAQSPTGPPTVSGNRGRVCVRITFTEFWSNAPLRPKRFLVEWWHNGVKQLPNLEIENNWNPTGFINNPNDYNHLRYCNYPVQ
jgi:hypothetical protein